MTENKEKPSVQTVRFTASEATELRKYLAATNQKFQSFALRLIHEAMAEEVETKPQGKVVSLPSPFDGLSDDQIWIVQNLIEIFKTQPQGAIFRNLNLTLDLAVSEYRKTRRTHEAAPSKAARESAKPSHRKPTGTGRHH